tara:strand:+ start:297 stop:1382 length:1086 start_codon:yes stop_codon:yes gene_type:complete
LAYITKETIKKSIYFNIAFFFFLVGGFEIHSYQVIMEHNKKRKTNKNFVTHEGSYSKEYFVTNEILGYSIKKDIQANSIKKIKDTLVYDVIYTIGKDGNRITPEPKSHNNDKCMIFFGCSITFGEGVSDSSSLPFIVGELQNNKVHNYGCHGYGPHQMLAAIENKMITCNSNSVIYQTFTDHVYRAAGYFSWDFHGPKYNIKNGDLFFDGHFDDFKTNKVFTLYDKLYNQRFKSYTYRRLFLTHYKYDITEYDINRYLTIVEQSRTLLKNKNPEVNFHVIIWDFFPKSYKSQWTLSKIINGFKQKSIDYHLVSNILPEFLENTGINYTKMYQILNDGHPNQNAYRLIAKYVVNKIYNGTPS